MLYLRRRQVRNSQSTSSTDAMLAGLWHGWVKWGGVMSSGCQTAGHIDLEIHAGESQSCAVRA
jgi:hypothetical protein